MPIPPFVPDWRITPTACATSPTQATFNTAATAGTDTPTLTVSTTPQVMTFRLGAATPNGSELTFGLEGFSAVPTITSSYSTDSTDGSNGTWSTPVSVPYGWSSGDVVCHFDALPSGAWVRATVARGTTPTPTNASIAMVELFAYPASGVVPYIMVGGDSVASYLRGPFLRKFFKQHWGISVLLVNEARAGWTTSQWEAYYPDMRLRHPKATALIYRIGGNDVSNLRPYATSMADDALAASIAAFAASWSATVAAAKADGLFVFAGDITFRTYPAGAKGPAISPGVNEEYGSKPFNDAIIRPKIQSELPDSWNAETGRPYWDGEDWSRLNYRILDPADGIHALSIRHFRNSDAQKIGSRLFGGVYSPSALEVGSRNLSAIEAGQALAQPAAALAAGGAEARSILESVRASLATLPAGPVKSDIADESVAPRARHLLARMSASKAINCRWVGTPTALAGYNELSAAGTTSLLDVSGASTGLTLTNPTLLYTNSQTGGQQEHLFPTGLSPAPSGWRDYGYTTSSATIAIGGFQPGQRVALTDEWYSSAVVAWRGRQQFQGGSLQEINPGDQRLLGEYYFTNHARDLVVADGSGVVSIVLTANPSRSGIAALAIAPDAIYPLEGCAAVGGSGQVGVSGYTNALHSAVDVLVLAAGAAAPTGPETPTATIAASPSSSFTGTVAAPAGSRDVYARPVDSGGPTTLRGPWHRIASAVTVAALDSTAPAVASAAVSANGLSLVVTLTEAVTGSAGFVATVAGVGRAIASATPSGSTITLALTSAVYSGQTVALAYAPGNVQDLAGNALAAVGGISATNGSTVPLPDATPPTLAAAAVSSNGLSLVLTFSESIVPTSALTGFAVSVAGSPRAVSATSASGSAATLALASAVYVGQAVSVTYSPGNVEDGEGNDLAAFGPVSATNGSTVPAPDLTPPTIAAAAIPSGGSTVVVDFSEPVSPASSIAGFAVSIGGSPRAIASAARTDPARIVLTLASPAYAGQAAALDYSPGNVEDAAGNALAPVSARSVVNGSTQSPPVVVGGRYKRANNAQARVAAVRREAGADLVLEPGKGAAFGEPSEATPMRVSIFRDGAGGRASVCILKCVGRTGDVLAIDGTIEGTADAMILPNDLARNDLTAGDIDDIYAEIDDIRAILGGDE